MASNAMGERTRLYRWLLRHRAACYVLMTLAFLLFGLLSLDLVKVVSANAGYLWENGWMGLVDGGFRQLLELLVNALVAIAAYLLFKLCEHALVHRLAHVD
ncbi:hypothetical protein [Pelomonas sp. KK5]|uniref:hypothetical protein n=1 Tax=Pelomonas sp. KK5 TaxID=1855730 RepID=UPI00097C1583|nr:hypothetical protein [Pelomonas sp. KK5]